MTGELEELAPLILENSQKSVPSISTMCVLVRLQHTQIQ
jgi:hypothetical protein